jgi:RNA polymerase sigma-70 factor (ECF subfamily)
LDDKYREVLVLKFLEEKNYQEISDIIKKPPGTVASTINKAKQEFRKELARQKITL